MTILTVAAVLPAGWAQDAAPANGRGRGRGQTGVDMMALPRPIDMHDTVWIEDMTLLEIRDSLKAGKTTALIFAGGMEDNGPYVTVSQHNSIVKAMCDSIARKLGNALCAPVVPLGPGNPETSKSPGSLVFSPETFKAVITDTATSLRGEGFRNIMVMVDHGANARPAQEAAKALNDKWEGSGNAAYY